jgi:hypothetical protein
MAAISMMYLKCETYISMKLSARKERARRLMRCYAFEKDIF